MPIPDLPNQNAPYINVEVKESTIPGAGKGLFAKCDFKKGDLIVEYLGEIITEKELDRRAENDEYGYAFYISKRKCIDAFHLPNALARYANDAKGTTKIRGLRNNSEFHTIKRRGWIVAKNNIKAGREILVDYGADYWKDIAYNIKIDTENAAAEN